MVASKLALKDQLEQERSAASTIAKAAFHDVYYVDSDNGNDGEPGTSRRHPVKTLTQALSLCQAGDTIVLNPGGKETTTAKLQLTKANVKVVCFVEDPRQGFNLDGAGTLDLFEVSAAGCTISGIRFTRTGATSDQSCIITTAAADRLVVDNCMFDDTAITTTFTGHGVEVTDDTDDVVVRNCIFLDCKRGVYFTYASSKNCKRPSVENCKFYIGKSAAFGIEGGGSGTLVGLTVENCIFIESDGDGTSATSAWDGTDGTDATQGPIKLNGDADQYIIKDCYSYTVLSDVFDLVNAIASGASGALVGNKSGFSDVGSDVPVAREATGEADIDISASDYTSFQSLITITPAAGASLEDVEIHFDLSKGSTGFVAVHSTETIQFSVARKIDGTNWRRDIDSSTTARGADLSGLQGQSVVIGRVGPDEEVRVEVVLSAEAGDTEIPYALYYKSAKPATITAVAAA